MTKKCLLLLLPPLLLLLLLSKRTTISVLISRHANTHASLRQLEAEAEADFWRMRVMRRQMAQFEAECGCTRALMQLQAAEHVRLGSVIVIDGSHFRWEGLGNSGVRWMGLLRWGYSTGRATFLRLSRDCSRADRFEAHAPASGRPSDATCHLDLGEFVTGEAGVDWRWGGQREQEVRAALRARGARELLIKYACLRPSAPGCATVALKFPNGTTVVVEEPKGMRRFFRQSNAPWIRLVLQSADSLEHSYSKPESLRDVLPLTKCPVEGAPSFRTREMALKCETFANMRPRPKLMHSMLPKLRELEPYDVVIGVHLRTGYADWQYRNGAEFFAKLRRQNETRWGVLDHWAKLDACLQDCKSGTERPCFNWESPRNGNAPRVSDSLRCRIEGSAPDFVLSKHQAPPGPLAALLSCAGRLGQSLLRPSMSRIEQQRASPSPRGGALTDFARLCSLVSFACCTPRGPMPDICVLFLCRWHLQWEMGFARPLGFSRLPVPCRRSASACGPRRHHKWHWACRTLIVYGILLCCGWWLRVRGRSWGCVDSVCGGFLPGWMRQWFCQGTVHLVYLVNDAPQPPMLPARW